MEFQHRFFREKAVKEYIQRQEKDYLPQFFSLNRVILAYLVLFVFLLAGLLVWCSEVPLFITGSGFVLAAQPLQSARGANLEIVLFLPARYKKQLHQGENVEWQVDPLGRQFPSTIQAIDARAISPQEERQLYLMNGYPAPISASQTRAQAPATVEVILRPVATNMPRVQIGEIVRVQLRIGSRHIF